MAHLQDPASVAEDLGREAQILGVRTNYIDTGSGACIVLLHGSGIGVSAASNWYLNIEILAENFRVVAPNLVGFGETEGGGDREYGIDVWVRHLRGLLDHLEIRSAVLVGNSLGSWIAAEYALAHSEMVAGLVLMGSGGTLESQSKANEHVEPYEPTRDLIESVCRKYIRDDSLLLKELVEYRLRLSAQPRAVETYMATRGARDRDRIRQPLSPARASEIGAPTLLVHGRDDSAIPPSASWNLMLAMKFADLVVLARASHWAQIERSHAFNKLVAGFATQRNI